MASIVTAVPTGYPAWSRIANIGDYDGSLDKEDSSTEAYEPYAAQWYRELHAMRGSGLTQLPRTLVDAENIAIARFMAAVGSRMPEKVRANATPARSDEKLEYWTDVLGIPSRPGEQRWQLRSRAVANYQISVGPTFAGVTAALTDLLGEAFVQIHQTVGIDLDNPPALTFWPVNPGATNMSLGGPPWYSERAYLWVEVRQPSGMSIAEFLNLMNVQMFAMLDKLLPAWADWTWSENTGGDFLLDISFMDLDGLTP